MKAIFAPIKSNFRLLSGLVFLLTCLVTTGITIAAEGSPNSREYKRGARVDAEIISSDKVAFVAHSEGSTGNRSIWRVDASGSYRKLVFSNGQIRNIQSLLTTTDRFVYFTSVNGNYRLVSVWRVSLNGNESSAKEVLRLPLTEFDRYVSYVGRVNGEMVFRARGSRDDSVHLFLTSNQGGSVREGEAIVNGNLAAISVLSDRLFFLRQNRGTGPSLWVLEPSASQARLVRRFAIDAQLVQSDFPYSHSIHFEFKKTGVNSLHFFRILTAGNNTAACQIWTSDGTRAGTRRVRTVATTGRYCDSTKIGQHNNRAYFIQDRGTRTGSQNIWSVDGDAAGYRRHISNVFAHDVLLDQANLWVSGRRVDARDNDVRHFGKSSVWRGSETMSGVQLIHRTRRPSGPIPRWEGSIDIGVKVKDGITFSRMDELATTKVFNVDLSNQEVQTWLTTGWVGSNYHRFGAKVLVVVVDRNGEAKLISRRSSDGKKSILLSLP